MPHVPPNPALALHACPPEFEALVLACGVPWKTLAGGGVLHGPAPDVRDAILHAMITRWDGMPRSDWSPTYIADRMRLSVETVLRGAERHQCKLDAIEAAYALAFGPKPGQPRPCDGDGHGFDSKAEGPIFRMAGRAGLGRSSDGRFVSDPTLKAA